ncbi:ExbD/TolR family protein [Moraxella atlantae]|uniref:Biopolymer transport protein exbD n=1 Tax=Faucicola atlantae TaxID=34059 RepID=A0A378Q175_9GAMM|nr:biopolymer transporter ExbD [Moraxella atlantae]OPH37685.1 biopolymer transporter ExbD [Moraxella atlantae]STY94603.1 Biopolymer transport protein exbD [Moraxella atlantae]
MAFQLGDDETQGIHEINLIPLIDIMLVLMIIFLVTATVLNPTVPLNLPKTTASVNNAPPQVVQISIDKNGQLFWDDTAITLAELDTRFAEQGRLAEPPTIQLRADQDSRYNTVAQVLATASQNQLTKITFVSDPQ